ncbi:MAG TPA: tRNA pseudouridine(38-40) synthase TruA [Granulicella sp.]|jgi:tRNA pseudouridine38-40 synthase|nr:tRNA pseudouridine(38-40) synthase TruA [Granulicella sp.]
MQHWKIILTYDGTPFHGWQIQPGLPTVQGTLAHAIAHVTGETVLPQGSGRTDTGVHALAQVATFPLAAPIPGPNLHRALNRALPSSIRILTVSPVPPGFHARHSALRKTYEYRIFPRTAPSQPVDPAAAQNTADRICSPMLAPFVWDCPWPLDLGRMQHAAPHILGEHDFTSFAASDPDLTTRTSTPDPDPDPDLDQKKDAIRFISESTWQQKDELFLYRVTGSGFLHHMVRNLVGTFVDIGAGRLSPDAISSILAARNRSAAGPTAPARGLFLVSVDYPAVGDLS